MISVDAVKEKTDSKVKTTRKLLFDEVMQKDGKAAFSQLSDLLLMAFSFGYMMNKTCPGSGAAFVNVSSIDSDIIEEYARLILYRHPEISSENMLWQKVQEYADAGIEEIHTMMVLQNKPFNIDAFFTEELNMDNTIS